MIPWYLLALFSAVTLSLSRIIEKKILYSEHALEFSTSTGIFRLALLLLLLPFVDFSMLSFSGVIFIYFASIIGTFAFFYRSKATRHMHISDVEPLFNLQPLFLLILSIFFLGEQIGPFQALGVLLLVIGTYILEITAEARSFLDPILRFVRSRYMHYVMFTILAFTFTSLFDKVIITQVTMRNPLTYLFIFYFFLSLNFMVLDIARFGWKDVAVALKTKPAFTFLGMLLHTFNIFLYLTCLAIPGVLVSMVIPIRRTSSLFSTIIGGNVFHEPRLLIKAVAAFVMVMGTSLIIVFSS